MNPRRLLVNLINIIISVVEIFLVLRFILKLLVANPAATFVGWLYATSEPLLEPFRGSFPSPIIERGFVIEFSTLFAIIIYALVGWLLVALIDFITDAATRRRVVIRE